MIVAVVALFLALPVAAADRHPVVATLVADVVGVSPGAQFELGVKLEMEEGWHVYWRNSGDSGGPTEVSWTVPAGFEAGSLQWPAPDKFSDYIGQEEFVTYGYGHTTLLTTQVQAAEELPGSTVELRAAVSWLVCSDLCMPGDTTLTLSLPVVSRPGQGGGEPTNVHQPLFEEFRSRLPLPYSADDPVSLTTSHALTATGDMTVQVELSARDASGARTLADLAPDFYPFFVPSSADFLLSGARLMSPPQSSDRVSVLQVEAGPYEEVRSLLGGLLSYQNSAGERVYRRLHIDLGEPTAALSALGKGGLAAADFTTTESQSLLWYLCLAALGGLILNVMPCVLPVISLKVLGFVSHAQQERGRVRQLGAAFSLGIVAAFATLAIVVIILKAGGEQIGWGFQFQSPVFILALTSLIFVLGMSLFGLVTVTLPGSRSNLGGLADSEGLAGSFFNGVLATILATPCTAPFLGSALGFAFTQPGGVIFAIFVATGLGMALPYLVLAAEPGWTRFVPKPGAWMELFKQSMGFMLMATVLWLLWILGKQLGVEAVVWTGAFLLCLAVAFWIPGKWTDLRSTQRQRIRAWGAAVVVVGGGYLLFLHPLVEGEIELSSSSSKEAVIWQPFSIQRVEELVSGGTHVFIDFTAEWCWTCKVNKRTVLDTEAVLARFDELGVQRLRADWTNRNPEITGMLRSFGRSGVPFYVVFPAGRLDHPLVLPELLSADIVLERLNEAARLSESTLAAAG